MNKNKINLSESYDYLKKVFALNGVLPVDLLYGDGTRHNNDYIGFCKLYSEMLKEISK